ncbi:Signal transduction histidine kinase [Poseidonocella pacifica]|uniref:histidine kinase n=1 Tax=Poseidonocella pacifica TaxID=871651 RepID=A0A1I0XJ84_9RHOB|nr:HAMP domain-containing sensor histidine kinase [Poseidonocella pacifica]SFB00288.1 Signal transduction histidine kinase [Poseidonocella pacifica]
MLKTLSGRFLILTIIFVMLAEILIFLPSVARFRQDFLLSRLERAQIASLALLADDVIDSELEQELLRNAGVLNVVLRRDEARQLILASPIPEPIDATFDLRTDTATDLILDALKRLLDPEEDIIRVIGDPVREAGLLIEVTMPTGPLRAAMLDYAARILLLSLVISIITAGMLFVAVRRLLVVPIRRVVDHITSYAEAPEDARRIIEPSHRVRELREAEEALRSLQLELTGALRQKERLAQLGQAVAKISHDLRNILTSAQLFADRIDDSQDPTVRRLAPKLVNSMTRAITLCESTLAFGRAEEPSPRLTRVSLSEIVEDVFAAERLAVDTHPLIFSQEMPPQLSLRADPEQLHRVLSNLVRNARQAIISAGVPGEIALTAEETATAWVIHVRDTGPGLPKRARDNIFKPFQGGVSKGGAGLGLTISLELIRGHGGELRLLRSDASGTTFEIVLPRGVTAGS